MWQGKNFYKIISVMIVLLAIAIPLIYSYLQGQKFDYKIKENSVIVDGVILEYKKRYKLADAFFYKFMYKGKTYHFECSASSSSSDYAKLSTLLIGKSIPVVVNVNEPEKYNKALIIPKDFAEYGIPFPDSMRWIVRALNK